MSRLRLFTTDLSRKPLVAQLVKNLLALQAILFRSLGWEDPLEKGKATHFSILGWRIPRTIQSFPKVAAFFSIKWSYLWKVKLLIAQLCPILCDPMDCSPPDSSVHGILQARVLVWVAMSSSRGSSQPRGQTQVSHVSCSGRKVLYHL